MQTNTPMPGFVRRHVSTSAAALLTAGLLMGSLPAGAQDDMSGGGKTTPPSTTAPALAKADQKFFPNAAQDGMLEVKLGDLAAQKATRDDVKSFAQKMVTDHTQINNQLKALAALKGVEVPDALDTKHQMIYDKLAALQGADFDREYVSTMVKGHQGAVRLFKKESSTQDTDIKSFVDKSLPVIQDHLNMVQTLNNKS